MALKPFYSKFAYITRKQRNYHFSLLLIGVLIHDQFSKSRYPENGKAPRHLFNSDHPLVKWLPKMIDVARNTVELKIDIRKLENDISKGY
jgi:hypothetical protein